jgi:lipopolysaccharide export LptBFGC system permease protein LptF
LAAGKAMLAQHTDTVTATRQAYDAVYSLLDQQAHLWAFVDNFFLFGVLALLALPLIFLFKRVQSGKKPAAAAASH